MKTLRLMTVGGVVAYRALFNWTTPPMVVGTLLVGPLFQPLFFAYLGVSRRSPTTGSTSSATRC